MLPGYHPLLTCAVVDKGMHQILKYKNNDLGSIYIAKFYEMLILHYRIKISGAETCPSFSSIDLYRLHRFAYTLEKFGQVWVSGFAF